MVIQYAHKWIASIRLTVLVCACDMPCMVVIVSANRKKCILDSRFLSLLLKSHKDAIADFYLMLLCAAGELYTPLSPKILWHIQGNGELWKHSEDGLSADFVAVLRNDYFT